MPWRPFPRIGVAVATYPYAACSPSDLPLEIGDDLYIIEEGGAEASWYRGYLVAPPSLLAGLTSKKGQALEARVFSGIFPKCCVEIREYLGDTLLREGSQSDNHSAPGQSPIITPVSGFPSNREVLRKDLTRSRDALQAPNPASDHGIRSPLAQVHNDSDKISPDEAEAFKANKVFETSGQDHSKFVQPVSNGNGIQAQSVRVRPQAPVPLLKIGDETSTLVSEPLVDEIASSLREWHSRHLHEFVLARRYEDLDKIDELVRQLDTARRQLLYGLMTRHELKGLREKIVWALVSGNKLMGDEIIVRDPNQNGRLLHANDSAYEISRLQACMSLLDAPPKPHQDLVNLHHFRVELKSFIAPGLSSPKLHVQIYSRDNKGLLRAITESFTIDLIEIDQGTKSDMKAKLATLFADLSSVDIGIDALNDPELCLVFKLHVDEALRLPIEQVANSKGLNERNVRRPATGTSHASYKTSIQNLNWTQKSFGSIRNRPPQNERHNAAENLEPFAEGKKSATSDTSRPGTQQSLHKGLVKRLIGTGLIRLRPFAERLTPSDHDISLWDASTLEAESGWDSLMNDLLPNNSHSYINTRGVQQLLVTVQSFSSPRCQTLLTQAPAMFKDMTVTPKIEFTDIPEGTRSDIYITLSETDLPLKALLTHPGRGTLPLPNGLDFHNLQLTLEARKTTGERVEQCIYSSSNGRPMKAWRSTAVSRGDAWNQIVKLNIPTEDVPHTHIVMSIADAPGFPFALGWMPLWIDGAFIKDGSHAPLLYAYDKMTIASDNGKGAYQSLPWSSRDIHGDLKDETLTGPLASVTIETKLSSTILSQDVVLLGILNWRQQTKQQTLSYVKRFSYIPEFEIVKLIRELFDALFSILVSISGSESYEDQVFEAIVTTLGVVYDRRFRLEAFVESYAASHFDHPFAAPCLLRSYKRLLENHEDLSKSRKVRAAFKVGRQILMFIMAARAKQQAKEEGIGATTQSSFRHDLRNIFLELEHLVRDPAPALIGNKTLLVQHVPSWLPELKPAFDEHEIFDIADRLIEASSNVQGKLILYKLVFIMRLSSPSMFKQSAVYNQVLEKIFVWISPYWGYYDDMNQQVRDQIRLCCSIVCQISQDGGIEPMCYLQKAIESFSGFIKSPTTTRTSLEFLFPTSYPFPSANFAPAAQFDEGLVEIAALIANMPPRSLSYLASLLESEASTTISSILDVIVSIINGEAIPTTWFSLYVYHHKSMLHILEAIYEVLAARFIPTPDEADSFYTNLWSKYLTTLLLVLRSDALPLETFSEQKRRAVWKVAGDVRELGAALLQRSWYTLGWETSPDEETKYGLSRMGGFQVQYVPALVPLVVEICLSVHEGLRGVAVRIFQSMIISEWTLNEDLSVVEAELIETFDKMFTRKGTANTLVQKMFVNELLDTFAHVARMPLDPFWQAIRDMVSTMDEMLDLLAAAHRPDIDEAMRITDTLLLMNFYKDMLKEDIFIRYVHQLADAQKLLKNKKEAGLALQHHANLYTWEIIPVRALVEPVFPEQPSFERKEKLYFEMIGLFEEGNAIDSALTAYRDLAAQYESIYDFTKLARTQRAMATLYEKVTKGSWELPRYFRVAFRGHGFGATVQDREFIYEADATERQSTFTERMRQLYPGARLFPKNCPENLEGQYLQITAVTIFKDLLHPIYQRPKVPQSIRNFITSSRPFRFAMPSHKQGPEGEGSERTVFTTQEQLPTILRRSEVVNIDSVKLDPLQTAVDRTTRKNADIASFEHRVHKDQDTTLQQLEQLLTAAVDSTSSTTIAYYRKHLPMRENPQDGAEGEVPLMSPLQVALQVAIHDHVSILRRCIGLFASSDDSETYEALKHGLQKLYGPELALLSTNPATSSFDLDPATLLSPPADLHGGESRSVSSKPMAAGISAQPATESSDSHPAPREADNENTPPKTANSAGATKSRLSLNMLKSFQSSWSNQAGPSRVQSPPQSPTPAQPQFSPTQHRPTSPESISFLPLRPQTRPESPPRPRTAGRNLGYESSGSKDMSDQPPVPSFELLNGRTPGAPPIVAQGKVQKYYGVSPEPPMSPTYSIETTVSAPTGAATGTGKMKKRLSLLGLGRMGSKSERDRSRAPSRDAGKTTLSPGRWGNGMDRVREE